ncbi:hypothetical protein [Streptomyces sp. NPDC048411]|uniref:hypothetical protein n=1 Tax=Streptomyces sp. NPDC048411 TaxID=3157206 RepID=UPI0034512BB8
MKPAARHGAAQGTSVRHRQAQLDRLLKGCDVADLDQGLARSVGELLGRSGISDPVDDAVAVIAADTGAVVLTSDPDDIRDLLSHLGSAGKRAEVEPIRA